MCVEFFILFYQSTVYTSTFEYQLQFTILFKLSHNILFLIFFCLYPLIHIIWSELNFILLLGHSKAQTPQLSKGAQVLQGGVEYHNSGPIVNVVKQDQRQVIPWQDIEIKLLNY